MRRFLVLLTALICLGSASRVRTYKRPERVGFAEYGMATAGSALAGATSWGGYLLWSWGSKAIAPDSWDPTLEIIGQAGLYGLGYGLLIPAGASSGVVSVAIGAGEEHHSWGAIVGGYAGSLASLPFAVTAVQDPTWQKVSLAAGSAVILPPLFAWTGYHLTPKKGLDETSLHLQMKPYLTADPEGLSAGFRVRF